MTRQFPLPTDTAQPIALLRLERTLFRTPKVRTLAFSHLFTLFPTQQLHSNGITLRHFHQEWAGSFRLTLVHWVNVLATWGLAFNRCHRAVASGWGESARVHRNISLSRCWWCRGRLSWHDG